LQALFCQPASQIPEGIRPSNPGKPSWLFRSKTNRRGRLARTWNGLKSFNNQIRTKRIDQNRPKIEAFRLLIEKVSEVWKKSAILNRQNNK
jgi:hypothetical protein